MAMPCQPMPVIAAMCAIRLPRRLAVAAYSTFFAGPACAGLERLRLPKGIDALSTRGVFLHAATCAPAALINPVGGLAIGLDFRSIGFGIRLANYCQRRRSARTAANIKTTNVKPGEGIR